MTDAQRPMQPDDLFRLRFLQGGVFSPDGARVAYTVSHVDAGKEEEYVTLYLYDIASGETRQMTAGQHRDGSPAFSPDGRTIAFTSDRSGKPQVYLLPVDGGEARQLTDLKQGAGSPVWSPDGTKIAFTAGVDYGDDDPPDYNKNVYRVTRSVWRFDMIGNLDLAVTNVYVIDVDGGEPRQLTDSPTVAGDLRWSPDGTRILYAVTMLPDTFRALFPVLRIVDLDGQMQDLAPGWGEMSAAHWLPDGQRVLFVGRPDDGAPIGTKSDLWVLDLATGEAHNRTPSLAVGAGGSLGGRMPVLGLRRVRIPVTDDGQHAYVQVQDGGTVHIYRVALTGPEFHEPLVTGQRTCLPQDRHGDRLLFSVDDFNTPPELFIRGADGEEQRITHINDDLLRTIQPPQTQTLRFQGTDGMAVEGWFMAPPEGEAPYPTILYIHGGPHSAYGSRFSFDFQMLAGAGYGVLFINHRASTGYGDRFATMIKGDWGNLDYGDLMAGVDTAAAMGLADPDRLGCCGTSGGGNLSCWIVGHTDRFRAAIPQNPVTNWRSFYGVSDIGVWFSVEELGGHPHEIPEVYERCSPITYAHRCTTPTLLVQSEADWRCPPEQSEQFYTVLKANGCIVEMLRQPGGPHGASIYGAVPLRMPHLQAMLDWFGRFVLGQPPAEAAD